MNAVVDALAVLSPHVGPSPGDEHLSVAGWRSRHGAATHEAVLLGGHSVALGIDGESLSAFGRRYVASVAPNGTAMNPVNICDVSIVHGNLEFYYGCDFIILLEHCWCRFHPRDHSSHGHELDANIIFGVFPS